LILDLDGCLVDSRDGIIESFLAAAREALPGRAVDVDKVRVGPPIRVMCQRAFPGLGEAELLRVTAAYRAHYDTVGLLKTTLFDGGEELLAHCVELGVEVDIATNKPMRAAGAILSRLDLGQYLRSVTTVDATNPPFAGKEELLRYLCRMNHLDGATAWYVGDTEEDRLAAEACGLGFIFAAFGYGESTHPRRIGSLRELIPLLEK